MLLKIVGTENDLSQIKLVQYFRAFLMTKVKSYLAQTIKAQKINIFESTITGEKDRVIYDSHLLIELETGKKMIFRIEPDGEEVLTVFAEVEDCNIEKYLRVSDVWFVHPTPIFDNRNEIIGLKSFYQTETKVRV